jgi:hypothetical protein
MPGGGDVADFCIWSHSERAHAEKLTPDNGFLFSISVKDLAINPRLLIALRLFHLFALDYEWEYLSSPKEQARIKAVENFRVYFSAFNPENPILNPEDTLWVSVLSLSKQRAILKILGKEYQSISEESRVYYEKFRAKLEPIPPGVLAARREKIMEEIEKERI